MSNRNSAVDKKATIASWQSVAAIIDHTNLRPKLRLIKLSACARKRATSASAQ